MQNSKDTNINQILDEVARISTTLMIGNPPAIESEPFYAHFFTGLVKKITPQADTLAVGHDGALVTLYINPQFWQHDLKTFEYRLGAVKHEILHIVFKHIFRYKQFSHKMIFNIAADIVVNQYVKAEYLVQGAVLIDNFPELNLEPNEHVSYYYNALMELYQQFSEEESDEAKQNESWQKLKSLVNQEHALQKKHVFWQDIEELSSAERDIAEGAINQALEATLSRLKAEEFGKLPDGLQQYLKDFKYSLRPVVNWKRVLRIFTNSSSRTRIKNTLRRPSKRYGVNPGIKVKKKQKILVALDTSGSITIDELQEFFGEIYHIWKQGAEITVVECDANIHQTYLYRGHNPTEVRGRGGTSFDAPLQYANQTYRPDALVYFTDGYGPKPQLKCHCPLLWMISRGGAKAEYLKEFPGRKVKMV